jgi:hypothetical protein
MHISEYGRNGSSDDPVNGVEGLTDAIVAYAGIGLKHARTTLAITGVQFKEPAPVPPLVNDLYYAAGLPQPQFAKSTDLVVAMHSYPGRQPEDFELELVKGCVRYDDARAAAISAPRQDNNVVFHSLGLVNFVGGEGYDVNPIVPITPTKAIELLRDSDIDLPTHGAAGVAAVKKLYYHAQRADREVIGRTQPIDLLDVRLLKSTTMIKPSSPDAAAYRPTNRIPGTHQSSVHVSALTLQVDDFHTSQPVRTSVVLTTTDLDQYPVFDHFHQSTLSIEVDDTNGGQVVETRRYPLEPTELLVGRLKSIVDGLLEADI